MTLDTTRLETLVIARAFTSKRPPTARALATDLRRFAPGDVDEASWRQAVEAVVQDLRTRRILDEAGALTDRAELARRLGDSPAQTWPQLADRILPALGLGLAADDAKGHARLASRDAWAAAIVARDLGLWTEGAPPSLPALCDAFVWRTLSLAGKPQRCPLAVRALFLQRELATDAAPADRLVRLLAARALAAPRPELRALRDALVRRWLSEAPPFATQVRDLARAARDGVFGDDKVFISSVWETLRRRAEWSQLTLDDFKQRLFEAHRRGELELARADLVAAMEPGLVAASEMFGGGARFHFIVRGAS